VFDDLFLTWLAEATCRHGSGGNRAVATHPAGRRNAKMARHIGCRFVQM
jgi:hypothetical protein